MMSAAGPDPAISTRTLDQRKPLPCSSPRQRWVLTQVDQIAAEALAKEARLPQVLAELLVARGITQAGEAFAFLNPDAAYLNDPFLMLGMTEAVERLERAITAREPVLLYGDYDVDGTTAVVLLKTAIEMLGGEARFPRSASSSRRLRVAVKRA